MNSNYASREAKAVDAIKKAIPASLKALQFHSERFKYY